jgi:hypothetical protein
MDDFVNDRPSPAEFPAWRAEARSAALEVAAAHRRAGIRPNEEFVDRISHALLAHRVAEHRSRPAVA